MDTRQEQQAFDEAEDRTVQDAKLRCTNPGCQEQFKRREHLMRHMLRHSGEKPFQCQLCSKSFPRRDTLQRHMSMHGRQGATLPYVEVAARTARACRFCAKSKQRCDGNSPCQRCKQKGVNCSRRSASFDRESIPPDVDTSTTIRHPKEPDCVISVSSQSKEVHDRSQDPMMRTKVEPSEDGPSTWFDNNHDRFRAARSTARRASIADAYQVVNARPVPGSLIYPSIESSEQSARQASNTSQSPRTPSSQAVTPVASLSRRASAHAPSHNYTDIVAAEDFGHVPRLPLATYNRIIDFYDEQRLRMSGHAPLPGIDALNAFVQLYFEYHHAKVALLHKATFTPTEDNWHLVLAVAAVGCEYSELSSIRLMATFEHLGMRAISLTMTHSPNIESISMSQSVLILSNLLLYDGSQEHLLFLQHYRSLLVTTCRRLTGKRETGDAEISSNPDVDSAWRQWILREQDRRYVATVWYFECLQYVTFDMPPTLDTGELQTALPDSEHLWACTTAEEWHRESQKHTALQSSIASVISSGPMTPETVRQLSEGGFLQLLLSLLVAHKRLTETYDFWIRPRVTAEDRSDGSVVHKYLDADMGCFEQNAFSRPRGDFEVYFNFFSILRFTPFSTLCIASGLRAGRQSKSEAMTELTRNLSGDMIRGRTTLLYAGKLYAHFRSARGVPRCDLQAFLAAALYIWAWLKMTAPAPSSSAGSSQRDSPGESIRIDQGFDSHIAQRWIGDSAGCRAQLAGVGILSGPDAAARVLKEAARVLKTKAAASTLGRSMADQLVRIVLCG